MNKEVVLSLLNKVIKVDRGGPESRVGMLIAAEDDHIALLTEKDGVVYYKLQHIKSITQDSKNGWTLNAEVPEGFQITAGRDFKSILSDLRDEWVKINRGGPESVEGVLQETTDDFATIVLNEEVIRLSMFHIRNISHGVNPEKPEKPEKKEKQEKQEKQENQENQENEEKQEKHGKHGKKQEASQQDEGK